MSEPTDPIAQLAERLAKRACSGTYVESQIEYEIEQALRAQRTEGRPPEAVETIMADQSSEVLWWKHRAEAAQGQVADLQSQIETLTAERDDLRQRLEIQVRECIAAAAEARGRSEGRATWQAMAAVQAELLKAAAKFPDWPVRGTDAAAIVAEECGELQQAVLQLTYEGGNLDAVRKEAVQTAAMAIQFLLNLPDTQFDRGIQAPKRLPSASGEDQ